MSVSIIVPVYNVKKYLCRCIDSILAQSYSYFDLILVDDGSPDNCGQICDNYAKQDARIHVIHKNNGGLSDARNVGIQWAIKKSSSEWITFVDSDDWIHPQYLEKLLLASTKTNSAISVCSFVQKQREDDKEATINDKTYFNILDTETFYCFNTVNATVAWGKLLKKELFLSIQFPIGKLHEDEFTIYKLLFHQKEVTYIEEQLYFYFSNPSSIMGRKWYPKRLDLLDAIEESIDFFYLNNFKHAYLNRLDTMKKSICIFIDEIYKSDNKNYIYDYIPKLRKKLRKYLRICNKYGLSSLSEDNWAFSLAYPKSYELYWKLLGIKNKIIK